MAFRKRIGLAKGLHLNFTGNGMGVGLRLFPGLSVSANRNGLYCNTSVPGTGFYSRNKVQGWGCNGAGQDTPQDKLRELGENETASSDQYEFSFHGEVTDDNEVEITIEKDGNPITDLELSVLKKYDGYKEAINKVHKKLAQSIQDETDEVVDIYKLTAAPISEDELKKSLDSLTLEPFVPQAFDKPEPTVETIRTRLEIKAKKEVSSILFWTNNSKRREYVEQHLNDLLRKEKADWNDAKVRFEQAEAERERNEKARCQKEYDEKKAALEGAISGDEAYVSAQIEALLSSLQMPVDFSVSYEYDQLNKLLMLQLDLPEIEDFPSRKASILSTGKVSIKPKTKFELNSDYAVGVCGLAFFFAGMLYNVSTHIQHIAINGFTQRVNGATGITEDVFVYSVVFNREQFAGLNFEKIEPILALEAFPHRINMLKTAEMKGIEPYEINEVLDLIKK